MRLSARARFAAACTWGCFAVAIAFHFLRDAFATKIPAALRSGTGDCIINWLGARAFERGIDIYSPEGLAWAQLPSFGHPPTTPLWFLPFTSYAVFELNQVYGHLLLLILFVHVVLVAAELRAPVVLPTALCVYALVCDTSWWINHVAMIQISEPIALLYVLAWIFLRRDHEIASGVFIGLALTLKLYAGVLVIMLLVGRRWRGALAAGAVYVAFAAAATWRFGFAAWRQFFAMLPATQDFWTSHIRNASVQGIVLRWWYPTCGPRGEVLGRATVVATLISIALVAAIAWSTRRALAPKRAAPAPAPAPTIDDAVDLPFALFSTASAWLNPVVWEHYDVTLILPIGIALFVAWRLRDRRWLGWALAVTIVLVAVALLLSIDMGAKLRAQASSSTALPHPRMHLLEVANWLPWPLTLAALALVVWRTRVSAAEGAPPAAAA